MRKSIERRWGLALVALSGCGASQNPESNPVGLLVDVTDIALPGGATRFDYQDIDPSQGHLIIAHMNDSNVVVANLSDGSLVKVLPNVQTARGIAVAPEVGKFFVTSTSDEVVAFDTTTLAEVGRIATGHAPDGVAWDPTHGYLGVSDQADGAISLIANAGAGPRTRVALGSETGNVVFDASRGVFWITVVAPSPPDLLVGIDPVAAQITTSIGLPGCRGAHGLRLHPDRQSAFVACEANDTLARVDLAGAHAVTLGATGSGPDVLALDPQLGWLYVAAESGDLTIFDVTQPGVVLLGHVSPGANSHTVSVDPATHRVFFPLKDGGDGTPLLRIMKPTEAAMSRCDRASPGPVTLARTVHINCASDFAHAVDEFPGHVT